MYDKLPQLCSISQQPQTSDIAQAKKVRKSYEARRVTIDALMKWRDELIAIGYRINSLIQEDVTNGRTALAEKRKEAKQSVERRLKIIDALRGQYSLEEVAKRLNAEYEEVQMIEKLGTLEVSQEERNETAFRLVSHPFRFSYLIPIVFSAFSRVNVQLMPTPFLLRSFTHAFTD